MYDTIIIGAGMSGLAAGIRLAYYDRRVCILERHSAIGGMNSFYRLRGRQYDVGLHAVTNFTPKGARKGPLARLLRQLRFRWEDFALAPQVGSAIRFPGVELQFGNGVQLLQSEIAREFPRQKDSFQRLLHRLVDYDHLDSELAGQSTQRVLHETLSDPLLIDMLLCPIMWYGNAREHDMEFGQFSIMFRSIFLEGLARPLAGVRRILKNLGRRFRQLGGELKLRSGVDRIVVENGRATGVVLDSGEQLVGGSVLSSAGLLETMAMCGDAGSLEHIAPGRLSFVETISVLDRQPRALGHDRTLVFFNDSDQFHWEKPGSPLCDVRSGVICSPNNFLYGAEEGDLAEGVIRVTALADFDGWMALHPDEYKLQKLRWYDRIIDAAVAFAPDFRARVIETDTFTPKTIRRFTWRTNGAVYGVPEKRADGTTPVGRLFICGTDQGFVGIVGAIVSGITVANRYLLRDAA